MGETNKYTIEEVQRNNGKNGARTWFIYKNSVYDVTDYKDDHPGGGELIDEWAGKNATKAFDDAGHSSDALKMLKDYKIGELRKVEETATTSSLSPPNRGCMSRITCGLLG